MCSPPLVDVQGGRKDALAGVPPPLETHNQDDTLVSYCKQFNVKTYKYVVINKSTNTASNNKVC